MNKRITLFLCIVIVLTDGILVLRQPTKASLQVLNDPTIAALNLPTMDINATPVLAQSPVLKQVSTPTIAGLTSVPSVLNTPKPTITDIPSQEYRGPKTEGLFFLDLDHGWVNVAMYDSTLVSLIKSTSDGGKTWTTISTIEPFAAIQTIQFSDALNGWAETNDSKLLHTKDGGKAWEIISTIPDNRYLEELDFSDAQNGWRIINNQNDNIRELQNTTNAGKD